MKTLLIVATIVALSLALRTSNDYTIFASRSEAPLGWEATVKPDALQTITWTIYLKQSNLDKLNFIFDSVSDPKNPSYGQFIERKELFQMLQPPQEVYFLFINHLQQFGSHIISKNFRHDGIEVTTTVQGAEEILGVEFYVFEHQVTGKQLIRFMGEASLPNNLAAHVDLICGVSEFFEGERTRTQMFPAPEKIAASQLKNAPQYDIFVTPSILKSYYNIPANMTVTNSTYVQGIAAFDDYFSMGALQEFVEDQKLLPPRITRIGPDCAPNCDEYESDLDVQYITGIAQNASTIFINQAAEYWVLQFTDQVLNINSSVIPRIFSISYGWSELAQCDVAVANCKKLGYNSAQYIQKTNVNFQKLGVMGITVLVSDGDDGAPSFYAASGNCPLDPNIYCPVGGCTHNKTSCGAVTIVHQKNGHRCVVPSGLGADECYYITQDPNAQTALNNFLDKNAKCDVSVETDLSGMNHLYSSCACNKLVTEVSHGYSVSGFVFNRKNGPVFVADYPTSSPYVTSVGASQFIINKNGSIVDEVACSIETGALITTGGGFSAFQPQPAYQQKAVYAYVTHPNTTLPPAWSFNATMRGYPDIVFNGHNYKIFTSDNSTDQCPCEPTGVDGTSCASPAFAGVVSLINDYLLNNGKAPLGFLNPLLYQMHYEKPSSFNDVSQGNNKCNRAYCCEYGYEAQHGWDPVVGLGSPNFKSMFAYIKNLKGL